MQTPGQFLYGRIVAALLLLLVAQAGVAKEYMTPEFAKADYRPRTMVVLPPRAEVIKQKMVSAEALIEEGSVLEDVSASLLQEQLGQLGYEVRALGLKEVNEDHELNAMLLDLNKLYDEERTLISTRPKDIRKRRFSLGDKARMLAARLDADALVITRIEASGATGGKKVMSALVGGSMGYAAMSVGVIAGDNGDVEAYFFDIDPGMSAAKLMEEPLPTMAKVTSKVLKDYPAHDAIAKYRKSWPQDTGRQVPEAAVSDKDALADFEALFGEEAEPEEDTPEEAKDGSARADE